VFIDPTSGKSNQNLEVVFLYRSESEEALKLEEQKL